MEIHITECRKPVECYHCKQQILTHEPMIVGKAWSVLNKGTDSEMHRTYTSHWHAQRPGDSVCCWLEAAMSYFNTNRKPKDFGGRKTLLLPSDQRKKRLQLQQRHARLIQMLKEEMEKLATDSTTTHPVGSWEMVSTLGLRLEELKALIQPLGGVPSKWLSEEEASKISPAALSYPEASPGQDTSAAKVQLALTGLSALPSLL